MLRIYASPQQAEAEMQRLTQSGKRTPAAPRHGVLMSS
jgi:hypothetical protein|eukprot:SAG25_NODE_845_length_5085_cov_16.777978_2_plen_38_part_00